MESLQTIIYFLPELYDRVNTEPAIISSQPILPWATVIGKGNVENTEDIHLGFNWCWKVFLSLCFFNLLQMLQLAYVYRNWSFSTTVLKTESFLFWKQKAIKSQYKEQVGYKTHIPIFLQVLQLYFLTILLFIMCLFFTRFINSKATEET